MLDVGGMQHSVPGPHDIVEQHVFDPHVIVEVFQVRQPGYGGGRGKSDIRVPPTRITCPLPAQRSAPPPPRHAEPELQPNHVVTHVRLQL